MITQDDLFEIRKVAAEFVNINNIVNIYELKSGHINGTYMIEMSEAKYILQTINTYVFNSPFAIMHNICEVTEHIRKKIIYEGKNPNRCVLNIIKTRYNQSLVMRNNKYWRCMQYIENAKTYDVITNKDMFYEVGRAVGNFQNLLSDFHTRILDDTIKNFHDTPIRFEHFLEVVKKDELGRCAKCEKEIEFICAREKHFDYITSRINSHVLKRRVTHNDTKLSNVMIDDVTGKALCLIDLDTVMKGSLLYDYGDALRLGASTAAEDEADLSKVNISLELFESFTEGFLQEVKNNIEVEEVKGLYNGWHLMTLEVAMRFLDDYLDGDKYFKVDYPTHNLIRALNQMKLVEEIEKNEKRIKNTIKKILRDLDFSEEYLNF
ncbi:MAG: aminoglycoside phosphotransferase family protein [Firmicutes bacterium]|nr:aminoglycoside phosphotransferase family protein [Bacillota bacterium]